MSRDKVETLADALKWLETSPKAPYADNGPSVAAPELLRTPRLAAFMKAEKTRDKGAETGKNESEEEK